MERGGATQYDPAHESRTQPGGRIRNGGRPQALYGQDDDSFANTTGGQLKSDL